MYIEGWIDDISLNWNMIQHAELTVEWLPIKTNERTHRRPFNLPCQKRGSGSPTGMRCSSLWKFLMFRNKLRLDGMLCESNFPAKLEICVISEAIPIDWLHAPHHLIRSKFTTRTDNPQQSNTNRRTTYPIQYWRPRNYPTPNRKMFQKCI